MSGQWGQETLYDCWLSGKTSLVYFSSPSICQDQVIPEAALE